MLYIYKVTMNPFIAKCAADAQQMHKYLCSLVHTDRMSANLLYKFDMQHGYLFLQSDIQPDETSYLQLLYKMDIDSVLSKKGHQDEIHFRLTTDTHMKKTTNGVTKKVYVPSDKRTTWLVEKLMRNGLEVHAIKEVAMNNIRFVHREDRGGHASITTHDFDIYGKISDVELLRKAWHNGMGEHKAYGNGLFLLCQ